MSKNIQQPILCRSGSSIKRQSDQLYCIGRNDTLNLIFITNDGNKVNEIFLNIDPQKKLFRLYIPQDEYNGEVNEAFIGYIINDITQNKPVYLFYKDLNEITQLSTENKIPILGYELHYIITCIGVNNIHFKLIQNLKDINIVEITNKIIDQDEDSELNKKIINKISELKITTKPEGCTICGGGTPAKVKVAGRIRNKYSMKIEGKKIIVVRYKGSFVPLKWLKAAIKIKQ